MVIQTEPMCAPGLGPTMTILSYADGTTDDSQPGDKSCGCLNEAGRDCETT
jgi:hypothetical protein